MRYERPQITILIANLPAERDRRVIRECLALEAHGYDVTVIAPRGQKGLRVLPGSRNTRLKPYPVYIQGGGFATFVFEFGWSFAWIGALLLGEVFRGRAHAVQVCNPPDVYWPLALLLRALRRRWVFDHHDLCPEVYATRSAGRPNPVVFRTLEALEWLTLRTAHAVVATNESYRDNAVRRGVPAQRITVVRNGPAKGEIQASAAADVGGPHRVVYLGVLGPQDNVEGAVLAAKELVALRGRDDWQMIIAGDGEQFGALRKLVDDNDLRDLVTFTGWLESDAVDRLLASATVAIQPDLPTRMNNLSTMAKTVEYLGRGVPVVAANLIETRRTTGDAAVFVENGTPREFATALNDILNDTAARQRMREIGLSRFSEMLSWEHQATGYVAVWDRLLASRRRAVARPADAATVGARDGAS